MKWFDRLFKQKSQKSASQEELKITPEKAEMILQLIQDPQAASLSCDQVYDLLDQYADRVMQGEDVADLLPLVSEHLQACSECNDEYEALARMLMAQIKEQNQE